MTRTRPAAVFVPRAAGHTCYGRHQERIGRRPCLELLKTAVMRAAAMLKTTMSAYCWPASAARCALASGAPRLSSRWSSSSSCDCVTAALQA